MEHHQSDWKAYADFRWKAIMKYDKKHNKKKLDEIHTIFKSIKKKEKFDRRIRKKWKKTDGGR